MKVGLLVIATRDYKQFVPDLIGSAREFFFPQADLTVHLFTDGTAPDVGLRPGMSVQAHPIPPHGFPEASLYRYAFFTDARQKLTEDFLFYVDVDCRFVGEVGVDALPNESGLVAVQHHSYGPWTGTFETDERSTAFTPAHLRETYCVGGINGGAHDAYLDACEALATDIEADVRNEVCAVWHDESHLNRYIAVRVVKVLPDLYCYPEEQDPPADAKMICLVKPPDWQERNRRSTPTFG